MAVLTVVFRFVCVNKRRRGGGGGGINVAGRLIFFSAAAVGSLLLLSSLSLLIVLFALLVVVDVIEWTVFGELDCSETIVEQLFIIIIVVVVAVVVVVVVDVVKEFVMLFGGLLAGSICCNVVDSMSHFITVAVVVSTVFGIDINGIVVIIASVFCRLLLLLDISIVVLVSPRIAVVGKR